MYKNASQLGSITNSHVHEIKQGPFNPSLSQHCTSSMLIAQRNLRSCMCVNGNPSLPGSTTPRFFHRIRWTPGGSRALQSNSPGGVQLTGWKFPASSLFLCQIFLRVYKKNGPKMGEDGSAGNLATFLLAGGKKPVCSTPLPRVPGPLGPTGPKKKSNP